MYKIKTTHQFEKDLKRCIKRGYPIGAPTFYFVELCSDYSVT